MKEIPLVEYFKPYLKTFVEEAANEGEVTAESVLKEGLPKSKQLLYSLMEDVLEEGSEFRNANYVSEFLKQVKNGKKGIILAEHYSNFDYPMFAYLLEKTGDDGKELIDRTYAIAGIKLSEENQYISALAAGFNRIFICPSLSLEKITDEKEKEEASKKARAINIASMRAMDKLRSSGHPILVFPSGTRYRPGKPETKIGRREIDSYIKSSDIMLLVSINGNCLRLSETNSMELDLICKDKMIITANQVYDCANFREKVKEKYPTSNDIKQDVVNEVMSILENMHEDTEKKEYNIRGE